MADARDFGLTELARLGFVDLEGTVPKLNELVSAVGDSGRSALAYLSKAANPDQSLNALLDLAVIDRPALKRILKSPESAQGLISTLGASTALGDFMRRHPDKLEVFSRGKSGISSPVALYKDFVQVAQTALKTGSAIDAWVALRLAYRTELLKLAALDTTHSKPERNFSVVAKHLSDMAGAALEAGLEIARHELTTSTEFGTYSPQEVADTALSVIAMGKCGAGELNYISDVDVIFVADSSDERTPIERALEIATKLATRMMRAMDGNAPEPALWQVDPNLRPEGKSGSLVRTLNSHVSYYEKWAQNWEFQALLKARVVAGDRQLGNAYETATSAFVWNSAGRDGFVESAQKMRERVMEYIPSDEVDRQIKLGAGGLRDIEFTVQLLQLVHGRTDETVHQRDTLAAIESLKQAGYISREDALAFDTHYRFLRTLEHRIQLSGMRRTHLMPVDEYAQRALARAVGLRSSEELLTKWNEVKVEVRSLHQKVFYRPLLSATAKLDGGGLSLSSEQVLDRLRAVGFLDPATALRHIEALTSGLSRRATIQKTLLPVILQLLGQGSDPDNALLAFRRLSEDLGESPWYLRMLRDSAGAAERLTTVLSLSRLATNLLEKIPEAAAWLDRPDGLQPASKELLLLEIRAITDRHENLETAAASIRTIRRRETLRVALGAVLGDLSLGQIEQALSDITEAYIDGLLESIGDSNLVDIAKQPIHELIEFAVIAMGRFGGRELGFGSDADVIYVYRPITTTGDEAQKLAERLVSELKRISADPVLEFELDIDLRPEGKNGPVARSLESYEAYYQRWSDTWEAQALLRARAFAGSKSLQEDFESLADRFRYPTQLSTSAVTDIRRIKARMETERLPQGADPRRHLKLGRGSLSDVEWLVQLLQLKHGREHPNIRNPQTLAALEACVVEGLVVEHDARVLREAWLISSRARSASVLWANKRSDVLPNDRRMLEGMARILEYPAGSASTLEQDYLAFTRRSRMVFERLFFAD